MEVQNLSTAADEFTSNVFLVDNTTLVDTGADDAIIDELADAAIDTVVITHSHWDHIENLEQVVNMFDPDVYAYEPDNLPVDATQLTQNDTVTLGEDDTEFTVFHTPGHKDDSICLYNGDTGILFSGDLIFPEGEFGRTDLDEGDRDALIESIDAIAALDVQELYAGHGPVTTTNVNEQINHSLEEAQKRESKYS